MVKSRFPLTKFKCHRKYQKGEISENVRFSENFDFLKDLSGFCYTSPPRGNQVGDLPRALHMGLGQLASDGCWRLSLTLHAKMFLRCAFYRDLVGT